MGEGGFEPPLPNIGNRILSPMRLPFRHSPGNGIMIPKAPALDNGKHGYDNTWLVRPAGNPYH